jgi:hypothetical protein
MPRGVAIPPLRQILLVGVLFVSMLVAAFPLAVAIAAIDSIIALITG